MTLTENTGTTGSVSGGTLTIKHNNAGGQSSIVFPSKYDSSDYGIIRWRDDVNNSATGGSGRLEISAENDTASDAVLIQKNGGYCYFGGPVSIIESTGTEGTQYGGTLTLEHSNNGGISSIIFRSKNNSTSDFAYLRYRDDVNNSSTAEQSRLEIGVENDNKDWTGSNDQLTLQKGGGTTNICGYLRCPWGVPGAYMVAVQTSAGYSNSVAGYSINFGVQTVNLDTRSFSGTVYPNVGCTYPIFSSMSDFGTLGINDRDDKWIVLPGYKLIIYTDGNYTGTACTFDNSNFTTVLIGTPNVTKNASSCKLYFGGTEIANNYATADCSYA